MSFPVELVSTLSGASPRQLYHWRRTGLLVPEVHPKRPPLYSFRDIVALRSVVRLRAATSLQKIRTAFARLPEYDLTDHPSEYQFATDGKTVAVWTDEGFLDLVRHPGQHELISLAQIYEPFTTRSGVQVADFRRPRKHLEVDAHKLGGWPTVLGTRVSYDTVARVVDGVTLTVEDVSRFYPGVSAAAAADALDFDRDVRSRKGHAA